MTVSPMFPLEVAMLPGQELPLRIFEPRYLNMTDDVMAGARGEAALEPEPSRDRGAG